MVGASIIGAKPVVVAAGMRLGAPLLLGLAEGRGELGQMDLRAS